MQYRSVQCVGGRIIAAFDVAAVLFDADTDARVASFDVADLRVDGCVVCDRWLPCSGADRRLLLLDCVAATLVDMGPPVDGGHTPRFTVAGPCVSARANRSTTVFVTHVSAGPDGTTAVREVARVTLSHAADAFHLCERGRAYVLHDTQGQTLQLCDVATGQCRRVFTPRELPHAAVLTVLTARRSAGAAHHWLPLRRLRGRLLRRSGPARGVQRGVPNQR